MNDQTPGSETPLPAMRRVAPSEWQTIQGRIRLHLDDLEAIEEAFRAAAADGDGAFRIRAANYEFDHAHDLVGLGLPKVQDLEMHIDRPYATFEVRPYGAMVYLSDLDNMSLRGLDARIKEIAKLRTHGGRTVHRNQVDVFLSRSTDPRPPGPFERHKELVAAIVGGVVGAVASGFVTILMIAFGILKTS